MVSALYQRRALKIDEPVVGLTYSRTGSLCKVLFGWLEDDSDAQVDLPTAHIVAARGLAAHAASGIFDLTDITSALHLAQYLLSLKAHSDSIRVAAETRIFEDRERDDVLRWRADQDIEERPCIAEDSEHTTNVTKSNCMEEVEVLG
ncbi:hypothetical protein B0H21DRAFT_696793 [Amylocystis lapponica]|nr:hypothetical protein B0H21DRAFT_696793 [Amylocystis lapponica]